MEPLPPTATHRPLVGQDTLETLLEPFTLVTFQAAAPPVGLLEMTTLSLAKVTQKLMVGQDIPDRAAPANGG
jgi:hypothetical protein